MVTMLIVALLLTPAPATGPGFIAYQVHRNGVASADSLTSTLDLMPNKGV